MSSIPLPALAVKPPEQQDPVGQYAKGIALQGLLANQQQQQQMRPLQMQQAQGSLQQQQIEAQNAQQAQQDSKAVTAAMAADDFNWKDPIQAAHSVINKGGSAKAAEGVYQSIIANSLKLAEQAKNNAQTFESQTNATVKQGEILGGKINSVLSYPDDKLPQALIDESKELDPQHAQTAMQLSQALQQGQITPADARLKLKALANSLTTYSEQAKQAIDNLKATKEKEPSKDDRAIAIYGKPQSEWTADDQNFIKGYRQYVKENKVDPGVAKAYMFGNMRELPTIDPNTQTPGYMTPNEINAAHASGKNPMPLAGAGKAMGQTALIEDIRGGIGQVRDSLNSLSDQDFDMKDRALISGALKSRDPRGAITQLMGGQFKGALSNKQQDYLINLANLTENAMAMRSVLGAGQGSEDLRTAITQTIPGASTPNRGYALKQLDTFEKTLNRLERGIPKVPIGQEAGSKVGSGTIRARDPQGTLHEAPAGTPLPAGWKAE